MEPGMLSNMDKFNVAFVSVGWGRGRDGFRYNFIHNKSIHFTCFCLWYYLSILFRGFCLIKRKWFNDKTYTDVWEVVGVCVCACCGVYVWVCVCKSIWKQREHIHTLISNSGCVVAFVCARDRESVWFVVCLFLCCWHECELCLMRHLSIHVEPNRKN